MQDKEKNINSHLLNKEIKFLKGFFKNKTGKISFIGEKHIHIDICNPYNTVVVKISELRTIFVIID
jgi:hypothetical protein